MFSPFAQAYEQSDTFGRLIFLGLYALSVICWVVLIYKGFIYFRVLKKAKYVLTQVQMKDKVPLLQIQEPILSLSLPIANPFSTLYEAFQSNSLELLQKNRTHFSKDDNSSCLFAEDILSIENQLFAKINQSLVSLESRLFILSTIVSLAPFLGLLGTVWGILITLGNLQGAGAVLSNDLVLGGLSLALTTTVLGLLIAMPALIGVNILKATLKKIHTQLEAFSLQLISRAELEYKMTHH